MLTDGRVAIRPYAAEDVDAVLEAGLESTAQLSPWFPWAHDGIVADQVAEFIKTRNELWTANVERSFAIIDAASGRYLGGLWLNQLDREANRANLGFWVRTSALRQGIASAAARLAVRYAFDEMQLDAVEIVVAIGFEPALRVAQATGARPLGIMPRKLELRGARVEAQVFVVERPVSATEATPGTP